MVSRFSPEELSFHKDMLVFELYFAAQDYTVADEAVKDERVNENEKLQRINRSDYFFLRLVELGDAFAILDKSKETQWLRWVKGANFGLEQVQELDACPTNMSSTLFNRGVHAAQKNDGGDVPYFEMKTLQQGPQLDPDSIDYAVAVRLGEVSLPPYVEQ